MSANAGQSETTMDVARNVARDDAITETLGLWDLPEGAKARCLNVSENATYLVSSPKGPSEKYILRLHRTGYHSERAIVCELEWMIALRDSVSNIHIPAPIAGRNGAFVQSFHLNSEIRHLVLFEHLPGHHPDETQDLTSGFRDLGRIAAHTHLHSQSWQKPEPFERLVWDEATILGAAHWGHWSNGPHVGEDERICLQKVEETIIQRLGYYGKGADRWGLIHGDMRLANLLITGHRPPALIDFDDCGLSWYLYDFAGAISFMEDRPDIPKLLAAWLEGYQDIAPLSKEDLDIIPTLIMLRRLALLGWLGTHGHAAEAATLGRTFAAVSARLGATYLHGSGLLMPHI